MIDLYCGQTIEDYQLLCKDCADNAGVYPTMRYSEYGQYKESWVTHHQPLLHHIERGCIVCGDKRYGTEVQCLYVFEVKEQNNGK